MRKKYKRKSTLLTLVTSYEDCEIKVSKQRYMEITSAFMKFIANKLLDGASVVLPYKMGTIDVIGRKPKVKIVNGEIKGLSPDWKSTLQLWKDDPEAKTEKRKLYHFNDHTGGIRYKFAWLVKNVPLRNKNIMTFIAVRNNKRTLWKKIVNEHKEYRIVELKNEK